MGRNFFFISGMSRSGSTLIDKFLSGHHSLNILSQPFPLLFVNLKKEFYKTINYLEDYYFLNNYFLEDKYEIDELSEFLSTHHVSNDLLLNIFEDMKDYSGQYTKLDEVIDMIKGVDGSLLNIYKELIEKMSSGNEVILGSKEVMCEEFMPFFIKNGVRCLIVLRDPRDVMSYILWYGKRIYWLFTASSF